MKIWFVAALFCGSAIAFAMYPIAEYFCDWDYPQVRCFARIGFVISIAIAIALNLYGWWKLKKEW